MRLSGADGVFEAPLGVSVIGRGSKSTVRIDSAKISRVHAMVNASREHVTIEDQGSANGTAVNGVRIKGRHALADGDLLSLGSIELRVAFHSAGRRVTHRHLRVGCFVLLLAVLAAAGARAQGTRATVAGTVKDSRGIALPGSPSPSGTWRAKPTVRR